MRRADRVTVSTKYRTTPTKENRKEGVANIGARIIVVIEICTRCGIYFDYIDINESLFLPPWGHVTHLDCMGAEYDCGGRANDLP